GVLFIMSVRRRSRYSRRVTVGSLYIQKEALEDPVPQRLKVTIEAEEEC
ncbi:unnamed protein product, partial [marine sediment metagenome]